MQISKPTDSNERSNLHFGFLTQAPHQTCAVAAKDFIWRLLKGFHLRKQRGASFWVSVGHWTAGVDRVFRRRFGRSVTAINQWLNAGPL
jgi:hypothetical protein